MSCRVDDARYDYKAHTMYACDCKICEKEKLLEFCFIYKTISWPSTKSLENEVGRGKHLLARK